MVYFLSKFPEKTWERATSSVPPRKSHLNKTCARMSSQRHFTGCAMPSHVPLAGKGCSRNKALIKEGASTNGVHFTAPSCTHQVPAQFPEVHFQLCPPSWDWRAAARVTFPQEIPGKVLLFLTRSLVLFSFFSADFHSQANKNGRQ